MRREKNTIFESFFLFLRRHPPRLQEIIEATQANSYHGFLPVLVRQCIDKLTGKVRNHSH